MEQTWGENQRYQRLNDDIEPPSTMSGRAHIGMTSSEWGALAAFEPQKPRRNRKLTEFPATVSSPPSNSVRRCAKVLSCGGEARSDLASLHDQRTCTARQFRDALLTREEYSRTPRAATIRRAGVH